MPVPPIVELARLDRRIAVVAQQLRVDGWTVEVIRAMRAHGLRPLLLKGPATVALLYADAPETRPYGDADLYVEASENAAAREVLRSLGFMPEQVLLAVDENHALMFERASDGAKVDLHRTLHGLEEVAAGRVWEVVTRAAETVTVGGLAVETPSATVRLLNVALHLSPHDEEQSKPWRDLDRALRRLDDDAWRPAAALASELGIEQELGPRLRRHPLGAELADRLGLPRTASARYLLAGAVAGGAADESALSIEYLVALTSWSGRARYAAIKLFPPREYLEARWPVARRGAAALLAARAARVIACVVGLPPAVWQWRRYHKPGSNKRS